VSWRAVSFEEAPFEIIDGDRGKNYPNQSQLLEEGHCLFLSATNVTKNGFVFDSCQFVTQEKHEALRKGTVDRGDVVLTTRGTLGNVAYYSESVPFAHVRINSGMVTIKSDPQELLSNYVYYYLKSDLFQSQVRALQSGAAQPQLPIRDIKKIKFNYPDLPTQERIASILSAYDDLIENNRRRIALLEQAARLLYREWFVHFRFPGHETAKFVDGLPEGWEVETYGDLFDFLGGFMFKSSTYTTDGRYGVCTIKNVHDGKFVSDCPSRVADVPTKMKPHCRLESGDVLLSLTGNVGRACVVVGNDYLLNQRVAKIVGKAQVPNTFVYWTFSNSSTIQDLENLAHGVAQLNLSPVKLSGRPFLRPETEILKQFDELGKPMLQQIVSLTKQNTKLTAARDLLLPRLMDGRIPV